VLEDQVDGVAEASPGGDPLHRPQGGQDQRQHVGAEVPQGALAVAPWGAGEGAARLQGRAQPGAVAALPAAGRGGLVHPGGHLGQEPQGEEDQGGHPVLGRGGDDPVGGLDRQGQGLVEQQVAAGGGRRHGQLGLDVGGDGDGDGVDLGQEAVEVVVALDAEALRERGRLGRVAAPDGHQLGGRVGGQGGGVRLLGPVAGADDPEP
jgi:hypothetical protein